MRMHFDTYISHCKDTFWHSNRSYDFSICLTVNDKVHSFVTMMLGILRFSLYSRFNRSKLLRYLVFTGYMFVTARPLAPVDSSLLWCQLHSLRTTIHVACFKMRAARCRTLVTAQFSDWTYCEWSSIAVGLRLDCHLAWCAMERSRSNESIF